MNRQTTVNDILADVRANGGNAKELFFKRAQEQGVDTNVILRQAQLLASKFR